MKTLATYWRKVLAMWKKAARATRVAALAVFIAVATIVTVVVVLATGAGEHTEEVPVVEEPTEVVEEDRPYVFAVMVENSADAWPLAGLDEAFLVIEAPVEGAIPRFVAFFSEDQEVKKIGPVRSARPYYLDWASEFDAVYAHVGGSPEALDLIASLGIHDLNEFYQGEYFYRQNGSRYAPHNVYTTTDDLRAGLAELLAEDMWMPEYGVWPSKDKSYWIDGVYHGPGDSLAIDWTSGTAYDVQWVFGLTTGQYTRAQGGTSRLLESGNPVADNVVVIESDIEVVDNVGRRHIVTVGEGPAIVAQDGEVIRGTWQKRSREDRMRFYDAAGNEISMNAGKTWIEVVPSLSQVREISAAE